MKEERHLEKPQAANRLDDNTIWHMNETYFSEYDREPLNSSLNRTRAANLSRQKEDMKKWQESAKSRFADLCYTNEKRLISNQLELRVHNSLEYIANLANNTMNQSVPHDRILKSVAQHNSFEEVEE